MTFRKGSTLVAITFDLDGAVVDRSVHFGAISEVTKEIYEGAQAAKHRYEFGGAVIALPSFDPEELQRTLHNALSMKLRSSLAPLLLPHEAAAWCRREG